MAGFLSWLFRRRGTRADQPALTAGSGEEPSDELVEAQAEPEPEPEGEPDSGISPNKLDAALQRLREEIPPREGGAPS